MFSSSCGCGFLINSWLAGSVAVARVEAISSVVLPVPLHFRLVTGSENGWGFFVVVVGFGGGFATIWQVIYSMMARSLVFSKASPTLGARIVLSV